MNQKYIKANSGKRGNAALTFMLIMVFSLALMAYTLPKLQKGAADNQVTVHDEVDNVMNSLDGEIIKHRPEE